MTGRRKIVDVLPSQNSLNFCRKPYKTRSSLQNKISVQGFVPCDRQQVLKRLPNINPPETDEIRRSWTDTFVEMLCDARASPAARTQNRGKRMNITPGKSVGVQDLAPQNSGNESPSGSSSSEEEPDCSDSNDSECIVCGKL